MVTSMIKIPSIQPIVAYIFCVYVQLLFILVMIFTLLSPKEVILAWVYLYIPELIVGLTCIIIIYGYYGFNKNKYRKYIKLIRPIAFDYLKIMILGALVSFTLGILKLQSLTRESTLISVIGLAFSIIMMLDFIRNESNLYELSGFWVDQ